MRRKRRIEIRDPRLMWIIWEICQKYVKREFARVYRKMMLLELYELRTGPEKWGAARLKRHADRLTDLLVHSIDPLGKDKPIQEAEACMKELGIIIPEPSIRDREIYTVDIPKEQEDDW